MEVIGSNHNNVNSNSWGQQYHRYSSISLASAANSEDNYSLADQSFHTCYDWEDHQVPEVPTSLRLTGRVASYSCLEDVQEEDYTMEASSASQPAMQSPAVVPLRSFSQLQQQQPLGHQVTTARLALSSDIGVLTRFSDTAEKTPAKVAQVLMDRDQAVTSSTKSMLRMATPRMTLDTPFRSSNHSLNSYATAHGSTDTDMLMPPVFLTVESKYKRSTKARTFELEDMADDIQLQIVSYVSLEDVRCLMATNRRYRKLLFTRNAQNLWQSWCESQEWVNLKDKIMVDDLSLPTAARPKAIPNDFCKWHQQANLSLLLSMAQSQPTDIDVVQLNEYHSHQQANSRARRRRARHRIHTTDGSQPLLKYEHIGAHQEAVVQFTGRVGQGDRCVRANKPFPRPTLIDAGEWMVPPSQMGMHGKLPPGPHGKHQHGLLDLFCRSARAVPPPRPAWRPFVAPFFCDNDNAVMHLTPRFASYFEVSIMEPTDASRRRSSSTDCVAVGVSTESFDWHTRMPGWDEKSFGFHGDDGGLFHASGGMLRKFGPSYGRGDVVGCGVDHVMRGIFFTLNGEFLGYGWTGLPQSILDHDLYPVVGIDTNDFIHCNFGNEPFKYDLKSLVVKHEDLVHQSLSLASPIAHSIRSV